MTQTTENPAAELLEELSEEELLAQFHEGAAPASPDTLWAIEQYKEAHQRELEAKADKEAMKKVILEAMDKLDVNKFTLRGVVVAQDVHYLQEEWDKKAILTQFPGVAAFIKKVARTRFHVR